MAIGRCSDNGLPARDVRAADEPPSEISGVGSIPRIKAMGRLCPLSMFSVQTFFCSRCSRSRTSASNWLSCTSRTTPPAAGPPLVHMRPLPSIHLSSSPSTPRSFAGGVYSGRGAPQHKQALARTDVLSVQEQRRLLSQLRTESDVHLSLGPRQLQRYPPY